MINSIDLEKLRNAEYIQFSKDCSSIVQLNNPADLQVQSKYDSFNSKRAELEVLFKKSTANPITTEIEALDARRDGAITGIQMVIRGFSYHFNPDIANPAKLLLNDLKIYTSPIASENYQAETAILTNLIADWESKPELTQAITALNLLDWKNEIKAANELFDTKYIARTLDLGSASPDNLKSKRTEANACYYDLRNHIDAHNTLNTSPLLIKTINEINALIAQYNALIVGRTTAPTTVVPPTV
jgi:Family of unknown function (DUF6261)